MGGVEESYCVAVELEYQTLCRVNSDTVSGKLLLVALKCNPMAQQAAALLPLPDDFIAVGRGYGQPSIE